jgi:hypothetical protein
MDETPSDSPELPATEMNCASQQMKRQVERGAGRLRSCPTTPFRGKCSRNQRRLLALLQCEINRRTVVRMANDLNCPSRESPSVVYPESSDDGAVVCAACGRFLATLGQYRRLLQRDAGRSGMRTSGC